MVPGVPTDYPRVQSDQNSSTVRHVCDTTETQPPDTAPTHPWVLLPTLLSVSRIGNSLHLPLVFEGVSRTFSSSDLGVRARYSVCTSTLHLSDQSQSALRIKVLVHLQILLGRSRPLSTHLNPHTLRVPIPVIPLLPLPIRLDRSVSVTPWSSFPGPKTYSGMSRNTGDGTWRVWTPERRVETRNRKFGSSRGPDSVSTSLHARCHGRVLRRDGRRQRPTKKRVRDGSVLSRQRRWAVTVTAGARPE